MKCIRIIALIIAILCFSYVTTFAFDLASVIKGAEDFITGGNTNASGVDVDGAISETIKGLATAGLAIGTIVAICAGIVIAITSMSNGAFGKANLKESLTPYIIGIVVLFAAWTIWAGVVNVMEKTFE